MTLHSYLLFLLASVLLIIIPGPDMVYMLGRCIAQGRRAGVMAAVGFNLGGYVHLTAAMLGLSAILATSAAAFTALKWAGAAYLVYLGILALSGKGATVAPTVGGPITRADRTILLQAFWSDVLNPKVALFFLALIPQFVNLHGAHPTFQMFILGITVNMIALPINLLIVHASGRLTLALHRNPRVVRNLQKAMGALFIALGLKLAVEKV